MDSRCTATSAPYLKASRKRSRNSQEMIAESGQKVLPHLHASINEPLQWATAPENWLALIIHRLFGRLPFLIQLCHEHVALFSLRSNPDQLWRHKAWQEKKIPLCRALTHTLPHARTLPQQNIHYSSVLGFSFSTTSSSMNLATGPFLRNTLFRTKNVLLAGEYANPAFDFNNQLMYESVCVFVCVCVGGLIRWLFSFYCSAAAHWWCTLHIIFSAEGDELGKGHWRLNSVLYI